MKRKQNFEERHGRRMEKKAGRLESRADKVAGRATAVDTRLAGLANPLSQRANRLGGRVERLSGRESRLRERADIARPGAGATPTTAQETSQTTTPAPAATPSTDQTYQQWLASQGYNPNAPLQTALSSTNESIAPYYVGQGQQGQDYTNWLDTEYGQIEGRTTNRFADMFSKYVDVANREADRQAGQIGESLGSRGALYSSANLGQQADLRQRTSQDIAMKGADFQTSLEDQRQKAWQGVMTGKAGAATAEAGFREAAMARLWQDYSNQSQVPPMVGAGLQWSSTRPSQGHSVSY